MAASLWKGDGYARLPTLASFAPIWHAGDAPRYNVPATVSVRAIHPPIRSASRAFLTTHNIGCATSSSATGVLVAAQTFDPWGAVRSGGVSSTEFNYTGQRKDAGTGLLFYNARYYDPALARFLSADTIAPQRHVLQTRNRYSYVLNNPLKYTDPSGHCPQNPKENDSCHAAADELSTYGVIVDRDVWDTDMLSLMLEALGDWSTVSGWGKADFARAFKNVYVTLAQLGITSGHYVSGRITIDTDLVADTRSEKTTALWFKQVIVHELAHRWDDVSVNRLDHTALSSELVEATGGNSGLACWGRTRVSSCTSL